MSASPFEPIPLFAVPLFASMVNGFEQHRDALVKEVLAHKERDPEGDVRSNRNGWHSGPAFQEECRHDSLAWMLQGVTSFARTALGPYYGGWATEELRMGSYWANVLGRHGFNAPHHHLPQSWSGVYYVQTGHLGEGGDSNDFSGWIEFLNPNLQQSSWGAGNFVQKPKDGMMLLFPSSQLHYVHPLKHKSQRITIAFNFDVVSK